MMRIALALLCLLMCTTACVTESNIEGVDSDCLVGEDGSSSCHLELVQTKAQAVSSAQGQRGDDLTNQSATCMVWGPSHVKVFDQKEETWMQYFSSFFSAPTVQSDLDITEVGDLWLVNSPYVKVQGRYNLDSDTNTTTKRPFLRAVTIGGKFLEDNTLTIGTWSHKVLWNQEEILKDTPSAFNVDSLLSAMYKVNVSYVEDPGQVGPGVELDLPLGIKMVVNRHAHALGMAITMKKIPEYLGGQDGQCGNFNSDNGDDTPDLINSRLPLKVRDEEVLFSTKFKDVEESEETSHKHRAPRKGHSMDEEMAKFVAVISGAGNKDENDGKNTCTVWGDPHITVFDSAFNALEPQHLSLVQHRDAAIPDVNAFEIGDCWLIKSDEVKVQGRYNGVSSSHYKKPFLRALAVGGPFLQNNSLVIGTKSIFWNDQEIMAQENTDFSIHNLLTATFLSKTPLVQDEHRSSPGVQLNLPLGVKILVNRHKNGLGAAITMPPLKGSQEGQCGNYNGDKVDDTAELIAKRLGDVHIPNEEVLFRHTFDLDQANAS